MRTVFRAGLAAALFLVAIVPALAADKAFERNVAQIVALGAYSHAALKDVVADTGIAYNRLECGIAHFYSDQKSFDGASDAAALMQKFGVKRNILRLLASRDCRLTVVPATTTAEAVLALKPGAKLPF